MSAQVWSIGGFDPSGGAGIVADNHVFTKLNIHAQTIITAITAQNGTSVTHCEPLSATYIEEQFSALLSCGWPKVIKMGLIPNAECVEVLMQCLRSFKGIVVYDPVMVSSSSKLLMSPDTLSVLKDKWLKRITVITPNLFEAQMLTGKKIENPEDVPLVANALLALGVKQVVLKGGHLSGKLAQDYWTNGKAHFWLSTPRIDCAKTHGTGCVFSTSLAAFLAKDEPIEEALVQAKMVLNQSLQSNLYYHDVLFAKLNDRYMQPPNMPWLSESPLTTHELRSFAPCQGKIGLYPIIDDQRMIEKTLKWKIDSLQLRLKNKTIDDCQAQIKQAIEDTKHASFQLFINDYWELALKYKAYGLHLGQEDLNHIDRDALVASGIRLGISTHSYAELARALAYKPSYIAFGPIHATKTKAMHFSPQGIERLKIWRNIVSLQLVAIGGLNLSNVQAAIDCGVEGISVVSAITKAADPAHACQQFTFKMKQALPYV